MRRYALVAGGLSLLLHGLLVLSLWVLPGGEPARGLPGDRDLTLVLLNDPPAKGEEVAEPIIAPLVPVLVEPVTPMPMPTPVAVAGPTVRPPGPAAPSVPARPGHLPVEPPGRSVVYLLDRSVSMGLNGTMTPARAELRACLACLPATCRFQVIAYHLQAEPLTLAGRQELAPATPAVVAEALTKLDAIRPEGGTHPLRALRRALQLRPEVIYLVTDTLDVPEEEVAELTRLNMGRSAIHVLELTRSRQGLSGPGAIRLTERNRGTLRRVVLR